MRICVVDTETTDLRTDVADVIELGYAIYDPDSSAPIHVVNTLVTPKAQITEEIEKLTDIRAYTLDQFGEQPNKVWTQFLSDMVTYDVTYLVGHNIKNYDMPVMKANMERCGCSFANIKTQVIDTLTDLPLEYTPKSMKLSYVCADHKFIMPFEHRALFDALACGKLLFMYDFKKVLALAQSPDVLLRAVVTYDDRAKASKRGFRWDGDRKLWLKTVKKCNLEKEVKEADFTIVVL